MLRSTYTAGLVFQYGDASCFGTCCWARVMLPLCDVRWIFNRQYVRICRDNKIPHTVCQRFAGSIQPDNVLYLYVYLDISLCNFPDHSDDGYVMLCVCSENRALRLCWWLRLMVKPHEKSSVRYYNQKYAPLQAKTLVTTGACEQEKKYIWWSEEMKQANDAILILMKIYLRAVMFLLVHLFNVDGLHSAICVSGLRGTFFAWRNHVRQ